MTHQFVILRNGDLETYDSYDEIPHDFQHVVKFLPDMSSDHDHDESHMWTEKLQSLISIERNNSKIPR
jgi:hypothetical protein